MMLSRFHSETPEMAIKIFMSYRRDDSAGYAGRIQEILQREFGFDSVFMDIDSIPLGTKFAMILDQEVAKCDVLVALIGRDWLQDRNGKRLVNDEGDFPRIEIGSALRRDIPVIPILLDGTSMPRLDQLPDDLKGLPGRQGLEVRNVSFRNGIERLIRDIKGHESRQTARPWGQPSNAEPEFALTNVTVPTNPSVNSNWTARFYLEPTGSGGFQIEFTRLDERHLLVFSSSFWTDIVSVDGIEIWRTTARKRPSGVTSVPFWVGHKDNVFDLKFCRHWLLSTNLSNIELWSASAGRIPFTP
jgi:TIR domain